MAIINATTRDGTGKGVARQLRRDKRIPAVIYGGGGGSQNLSLDLKEFTTLMQKEKGNLKTKSQVMVLDENQRTLVLLREIQYHPVTSLPLHADFIRFDPNRFLEISVPVHVVDEDKSPGCKRGGIAQHILHDVEIHCRAGDIPDFLEVSVAGLDIGDVLHVSDIKLPEGVELHSDASWAVVTIAGVKVEAGSEEE